MPKSFPPIARFDAEMLILGSMPSECSIAKNQYYAYQRNAFWPIMGALFDFDPGMDYEKRKRELKDNRIALWDVLQRCERCGSLDSAIESVSAVPNDFRLFFAEHPRISRIFFNGAKAESEYKRLVIPELALKMDSVRLPSTSPAMALLTIDAKTAIWAVVAKNRGGGGTSI